MTRRHDQVGHHRGRATRLEQERGTQVVAVLLQETHDLPQVADAHALDPLRDQRGRDVHAVQNGHA